MSTTYTKITDIPHMTQAQVEALPTAELLQIWNCFSGGNTKKFSSRAKGLEQVLAVMAKNAYIRDGSEDDFSVPPSELAPVSPEAAQPQPGDDALLGDQPSTSTVPTDVPTVPSSEAPATGGKVRRAGRTRPAKPEPETKKVVDKSGIERGKFLKDLDGHFTTAVVSIQQLMELCGATERQIRNGLDNLRRRGVIVKRAKDADGNFLKHHFYRG